MPVPSTRSAAAAAAAALERDQKAEQMAASTRSRNHHLLKISSCSRARGGRKNWGVLRPRKRQRLLLSMDVVGVLRETLGRHSCIDKGFWLLLNKFYSHQCFWNNPRQGKMNIFHPGAVSSSIISMSLTRNPSLSELLAILGQSFRILLTILLSESSSVNTHTVFLGRKES